MCLQIKTSLVVLNEDNKNQTLVESRRSYGLIKEKKTLGMSKLAIIYVIVYFVFFTQNELLKTGL